MKTQSIALRAPRHTGRSLVLSNALLRARSLPCLALAAAAFALPVAALAVLAAWATGVPAAMPVAQSAAALSGLVFLALALDSEKRSAILQVAAAVSMFALTWASASLSPEFLVPAAMVAGARAGGGLFLLARRRCLQSAAQDRPPAGDIQKAH